MALVTLSEPFPHPGKSQGGLPEIPGYQPALGAASTSGSASLPEQRRHARTRIARAATVVINKTNAALVVNLGQGGMRVQALGRRLELGANLRLQFQLPGSVEAIRTSAAVAWVNDTAEAGLRFARLSGSLRRRLRNWIAKNGVANAAREVTRVAGGWQAALDLMADLTRMLTGACCVTITLVGRRLVCSRRGEELPNRAIVAAPIYECQRVVGHLEISSPELGAFDEPDLGVLSVLAAVTGEIAELQSAQRTSVRKAAPLPARIASRLEGMLPTIRVRLVP